MTDEKTQVQKMTEDARYNRTYGEHVIPTDEELEELLQNIERANESSDFTKENLIDYLWAFMEASLVRMDELRMRDEQLRRLARSARDHAGKYTRAFGKESNAERVLELTDGDIYNIGARMLMVLDGQPDPGDSRYICGTVGCGGFSGHAGAHDIASPDDPHRNEPEGTGEA